MAQLEQDVLQEAQRDRLAGGQPLALHRPRRPPRRRAPPPPAGRSPSWPRRACRLEPTGRSRVTGSTRTWTIWPSASSSRSASARESCADSGGPSPGWSSTRTSKPSRASRTTSAGSRALAGVLEHLDVVRAHEPVADLGHRADERHHELVRRAVVDLVRRRGLLHAALVDDHDLLGDLQRLLLVVRDEDRRHVDLVVEAAQPRAQLLADAGVERAERLVEQQHLRLDGQRAGERHPLALAAGELARVALAEVAEADEVQQLLHAGLDLVLRALLDGQAEADVVGHRHVLERGVVLEDEADLAALRRVVGDLLAADHARCRRPAPRGRRSRAAASTCRRRTGRAARSASRRARRRDTSSSARNSP